MAISKDGTERSYIVRVPNLEDVSDAEWREYIADAVGSMKGGMNPECALFDLDPDDVKCVRAPAKDRALAAAEAALTVHKELSEELAAREKALKALLEEAYKVMMGEGVGEASLIGRIRETIYKNHH